MASIVKLNGKWRALIRRKGHQSISKWFDTKAKASIWAAEVEASMMSGAPTVKEDLTIAECIKQYRKLRSSQRPIMDTSTEHYTLKMLDRELGHLRPDQLTPESILSFAQQRRDAGVGAYTVNCDLSKLGTVLRYTAQESLQSLAAARPKLTYMGLIGGGGLRERRPTEEELTQILSWLEEKKGRMYRDFVEFSALTAMRRSEVSRLLWADLNEQDKTVLVRDRKDPRQKIGNDQIVPLLAGSYDILIKQSRVEDRIFPLHPQTVTKYFTECCKALSIPDLHLHDLRHEGISQMFEHGLGIQHVSVVSGHKDWRHLKRYTQIKPASLHALDTRQGKQPQSDSQTTASHPPDTTEP